MHQSPVNDMPITRNHLRYISVPFFLALMTPCVSAQEKGYVSGGVESNSALYSNSAFHSNNYLKLDYVRGRFSAGLQAEYYPNPLLGYDLSLKGVGLPGKYMAWTDETFGITVGDFYDQFGTGIIFRSWEDRDLGWNNSLGGGRVSFRSGDGVFSAKALGGFARKGLWYGSNALSGAEASLQLGGLQLGGSTVVRFGEGAPSWAWSAVSAFERGGFSARAEWVGKQGGNAQTLELSFAKERFSSALTLRRLQNMLDPAGLNYLPSLCLEQSYALASLNPYTTFAAGELGGSIDLFYRLKTSWKFHLNGSYIFALPSALKRHDVLRMTYRDLNAKVEKRWGRQWETVAFVSIQEQSPSHGERKATDAQNAFVLDVVYKTGKKLSVRTQLQYLYSQELTRDWMAASAGISSTSGWSFHVQDMYNHGSSKVHYYEVGAGWTRGAFKADLAFGHQRAGLVCSGGVCRWQPEYRGCILRLSYQIAR